MVNTVSDVRFYAEEFPFRDVKIPFFGIFFPVYSEKKKILAYFHPQ